MLRAAFASAVAFAASTSGDITFSRTVTATEATGKLTFDHGCTSSDAWGSNDCDFKWGDTFQVVYQATLKEDITSGKLNVDMKVNGIVPFKFDCAICGANCTFKIPIVGTQETFEMPPCPIKALTVGNTTAFTLPGKNPIGIGAKAAGTVSVTDQSGNNVASISIQAQLK